MTVYDVVYKIIGPIDPIGETNEDACRLENLEQMGDLVEALVTDIDRIASRFKEDRLHSRKQAGQYADKILDDLGIQE